MNVSEGGAMEAVFTAVFKREGGWVLGWVEELPGANVQERTIEEARESLKEAIRLIIESNRQSARGEDAGEDVVREQVAVALT
jgi:predicted RNase H-like HicB family nuclease